MPMPKKKSSDPLVAMPKKRRVMPYVVLLVFVLIFSGIFIYNMLLNTHVAVEKARIPCNIMFCCEAEALLEYLLIFLQPLLSPRPPARRSPAATP